MIDNTTIDTSNDWAMSLDGLDLSDLRLDTLEVSDIREAIALPETGASSVVTSCDSCSCCGSSSCCP